jgi:transposase
MLSLPATVRVFLCTQPIDLRLGFDRLAALAHAVLASNPLSGHLFVFKNRRADKLKILYWEPSGFCIRYKRLEAGTFAFPATGTASVGTAGLEIRPADLVMLIDGVDPARVHRRTRYQHPPA